MDARTSERPDRSIGGGLQRVLCVEWAVLGAGLCGCQTASASCSKEHFGVIAGAQGSPLNFPASSLTELKP